MSGFDYSKWDNIELSDDESDCHPNIDKASWFRMKHRSRVEREAREADERQKLETANKQDQDRVDEIVESLAEEEDEADREALEAEMQDLEKSIEKRDARIAEMEKNKKWNVDNMCQVVEERTVIGTKKDTHTTSELSPELAEAQAERNKGKPGAAAAATEAAAAPESVGPRTVRAEVESYSDFVERHEDLLERFIELPSLDESRNLLHQEGDILMNEHASSYLLLSCLEDEMNGKHERMRQVARQSQILTHVADLATSLRRPPRDVVLPFFKRISEDEYLKGFLSAVDDFITRIQKRAVEKRKEMDAEAAARGEEETTELSREERMGPGGLDPIEVFESLPEAVQEAFESQDTTKLKEALMAMPQEEAAHHMKRCVDSGLWVSNAGDP